MKPRITTATNGGRGNFSIHKENNTVVQILDYTQVFRHGASRPMGGWVAILA